MANPEHLKIVKQGAVAIRGWRKSHPAEQLDLQAARIRNTDLGGVDLQEANLVSADLSDSDLSGALFLGAVLHGTTFQRAALAGTVFIGAHLASSVFCDVDLSECEGLDRVNFYGPCSLGVDTLTKSKGAIPNTFLRGCGLADWEIEQAQLYREGLSAGDIIDIQQTVFDLRHGSAIRLHPVFLSHSSKDKPFVLKLYDGLQDAGVRCWLGEKQMVPGDELHETIDRGIDLYDKFVLVCSEASLSPVNSWVKREMRRALAKEEEYTEKRGRPARLLIPIMIDDYALKKWEGDGLMRSEVKGRIIGDFRDPDAFDANLKLLIRALRTDEGQEPAPPSYLGEGE